MAHLACKEHKRRVQVYQRWVSVDSQGGQQWIPSVLHRADGTQCRTGEVKIGPVTLTVREVMDRFIDDVPLYGVGKKFSEYRGRHRSDRRK